MFQVCIQHFRTTDYSKNKKGFSLNKHAVPSIFHVTNPTDLTKSPEPDENNNETDALKREMLQLRIQHDIQIQQFERTINMLREQNKQKQIELSIERSKTAESKKLIDKLQLLHHITDGQDVIGFITISALEFCFIFYTSCHILIRFFFQRNNLKKLLRSLATDGTEPNHTLKVCDYSQ